MRSAGGFHVSANITTQNDFQLLRFDNATFPIQPNKISKMRCFIEVKSVNFGDPPKKSAFYIFFYFLL